MKTINPTPLILAGLKMKLLKTTFVSLMFSACTNAVPSTSFSKSDECCNSPLELIDLLESEVINGHRLEVLDSLLADDFIFQTIGQSFSKSQFKWFFANNFAAIPDWQGKLRVVEAVGNQALVIATVTGTHTGTSGFLGFQPSGKSLSFTDLFILSFADGQITGLTAQADFSGVLAQLGGNALARTLEEMSAELDLASHSQLSACDPNDMEWNPYRGFYYSGTTLNSVWEKMRTFMADLDGSESALNRMLVDKFRLTSSGGLNQSQNGVSATFQMASAIGRSHDNSGLTPIYMGNLFVAVAGLVKFDYLNPTGLFGLPVSTDSKAISMFEVQLIGVCNGKVWRQYSHADFLGLMRQIGMN